MAKKQDLFPNWSVTFQMEVDEDAKAFFERMVKEHKEFEEAVRNRIKQLFDEHVIVEGELAEAGYIDVLNVFAVGYQLGWNDCHIINEEK